MYHPLPTNYLYSACRITADFDDYGTIKPRLGTAFMVRMKNDEYFLITNRHVLDPTFGKGLVAAHQNLVAVSYSGFSFELSHFVGRCGIVPTVLLPLDPEEDIAAISLKSIRVENAAGTIHVNAIHIDHLADVSYFESLNPGDFVSMPGYPEWFDHAAGRPILRSGTLASDPRAEYRGPKQTASANRRLIEAFSFGGSSGSPVFALGFGFGVFSDMSIPGSRELRLIGINAGHLKIDGDGGHSGLSFMFTSLAISKLLEQAQQS